MQASWRARPRGVRGSAYGSGGLPRSLAFAVRKTCFAVRGPLTCMQGRSRRRRLLIKFGRRNRTTCRHATTSVCEFTGMIARLNSKMLFSREQRESPSRGDNQGLRLVHCFLRTRGRRQQSGLASADFGSDGIQGPGIFVPTRNAALFRWCLESGLRVVQPMTLMTIGLYNEPAGAYLPSILY